MYHHGDLAEAVVTWIAESDCLEKVLSIDLETKVLKKEDFLTGEPILSVSLAYFEDGKTCKKVIVLEDENLEAEGRMFDELETFLSQKRPLLLLGYNLCGYDIPLIHLRLRKHPERIYWVIQDTIDRSFLLDMKHPIRFELAKYAQDGKPKILPLAKVVKHERWDGLPLMRTKNIVSETQGDKGCEINRLWKDDREKFLRYTEGDANDILLIFRELFKSCMPVTQR